MQDKRRVGGWVSSKDYKKLKQLLLDQDKSFSEWLKEKIFWEVGDYCAYEPKDFKELFSHHGVDSIVAENLDPFVLKEGGWTRRFEVYKKTFFLRNGRLGFDEYEEDPESFAFVDFSDYKGKFQVNINQYPSNSQTN